MSKKLAKVGWPGKTHLTQKNPVDLWPGLPGKTGLKPFFFFKCVFSPS